MRTTMQEEPLGVRLMLQRAEELFAHRSVHQLVRDQDGVPRVVSIRMGEVTTRARALALVLDDLGIAPGAVVGTFAWNTVDHLVPYLAIPASGRVLHTVNVRLHPQEIAYVLDHAADTCVLVDADLWDAFSGVELPPAITDVLVMGQGQTHLPEVIASARVHRLEDLTSTIDAHRAAAFAWPRVEEDSASGVCYTSGTTGPPKGVVYSHRSTYLHALTIAGVDAFALGEREMVMPVVPMFHASGWGLPYAACLTGAGMAMPGRHLDPDALATLIRETGVTLSVGVPTVWWAILEELEAGRMPVEMITSLHRVVVGGSAVPASLIEAFDRFDVDIVQGWGMTELSPVGLVSRLPAEPSRPEDAVAVRARQGRPLPGLSFRLIDDRGDFLPHDGAAVGELVAHGPWVTASYHGGAGDDSFFEREGVRWLRTGDVAHIDDQGFVTLVDRAKDLIKSGGEWISTVDLENTLMAHPSVREVAVIGVPHEKYGERPLAFVVTSQPVPEQELREHLTSRLARWQVPDRFVIVDSIPKTSVGKLDKKVLRAQHT